MNAPGEVGRGAAPGLEGAGAIGELRDVLWLDEPEAADVALTGAKAAALARAARVGLPTVPGFVLTTDATASLPGAPAAGPDADNADAGEAIGSGLGAEVQAAWRRLSDGGRRALVVRSSSTVEDLDSTSMAGRFTSVVGVTGWRAFATAVGEVVRSREGAAVGVPGLTGREPIAVLVQPLLDSPLGGVLFGVDPVSGRNDRLLVTAVSDGPEALVSGRVTGTSYELDYTGRCVHRVPAATGGRLSRRRLRQLVRLARQAADLFGGPQDIEWAIDGDGRLRLLQSRAVTTEVRGAPRGPLLGPGPVSETFPDPLAPLEVDLWVQPLRDGIAAALALAGTPPRRIERSPVVTVVGGRVAVDLDLLGATPRDDSWSRRLDPRPGARRLRTSWRIARLRGALPGLAEDMMARADAELRAVPSPADLTDHQLLALLFRARAALRSLHAHEILVGLLIESADIGVTGTAVALRVLAAARAEGLGDEAVVSRHPVVLTLVPPRVGGPVLLPRVQGSRPPALRPRDTGAESGRAALVREALRLRARWTQELTARAAEELGRRLAASGWLPVAEDIRRVRLEGLDAFVREGRAPSLNELPEADAGHLPAQFRLDECGRPVPEKIRGACTGGGIGAGGGRGRGPVHIGGEAGSGEPAEGSVLVVTSLDPSLAPVLPRLAGLVAETGSPLAHLAILAREAGVPTVVGVPGATQRFAVGATVTVDGGTGEVLAAEDGCPRQDEEMEGQP